MSGYSQYMEGEGWTVGIYTSIDIESPKDVQGNESFSGYNSAQGQWSHNLTKGKYDEGALLRTDMARVRCVRKQ